MDGALTVLRSLAFDALTAVNSAVLIVDACSPDLPIVDINPAFETLTGYGEADVIGRNCRFLQGPDTDRTTVARVREDLAARRPSHAVLLNYRKDGMPFVNGLFINPICDTDGNVTHFVGCQNAVENERLASLRADSQRLYDTLSPRERETFEGLVRGATVKEIARDAALSPRTVEKYRYRMQSKMGSNSLTMLVRQAIALGIVFRD